jgi:dTMP kinase
VSKVIVIEGADRCGKATQSKLLRDYIRNVISKRAEVVEVPIKSPVTYRLIYWMLSSGTAKKFPKLFQWIQFANRKIFQVTSLSSLMRKNNYIIFDRWSLSTVVYGEAEGVPRSWSEKLAEKLVAPDHTILLLGKPHTKDVEDVYEKDAVLQDRVRDLYEGIRHPITSTIIDCDGTREEVHEKIVQSLKASDTLA